MNKLVILLFLVVIAGCSATPPAPPMYQSNPSQSFVLSEMAPDKTYGYSEDNPIIVGDGDLRNGAVNEHMYLRGLAGPDGSPISYRRIGSCCAFETPNGFGGSGLLDKYEVHVQGKAKPVILYLDFYRQGPLYIPHGFTAIQ